MASIIQGFEYDIFISYRHNDNRSGWVTEFVQHLNEELAATFKEPVSVYFDSNPHDGLLETHHVDKSLEGKLKCAILIPILSQTYCDAKSFAWKHEFCAFNELSKNDQFGRDVRLNNGNVSSRILPIKIHELDAEDKLTFENEIGGVLRAIEFIYKEPGVNRPLLPTDNKNDNHNKTDYRNQVNKVANAVKEIISAIKNPMATKQPLPLGNQRGKKSIKGKLVVGLIILVLLLAGYFFYSRIFSAKHSTEMEKSIAVLPFVNISDDPGQELFSEGLTEEIIDRLTKIKGLRVVSHTSVMDYKNPKKRIPEIAKELGVALVLRGSVRKSEKGLRITVQLINGKTDEHIWSEAIDKTTQEIFEMQREIATQLAGYFQITLTSAASGELNKMPTTSIAAYDCYLKGRGLSMQRKSHIDEAITLYKRAIKLDQQYADAFAYLSYTYSQKADQQINQWSDSALYYAKVAYGISPELGKPNFSMGFALWRAGNDSVALPYFRRAARVERTALRPMSNFMLSIGKIDSSYFFANQLTGFGDQYSSEHGLIQKLGIFISVQGVDSLSALIDKISKIKTVSSNDRDIVRSTVISALIYSKSFQAAIKYIGDSYTNEKDPSLAEQRRNFLGTIYAMQEDWENFSKVVTEQDKLLMALMHKKLNHKSEFEKLAAELSHPDNEHPLSTIDDINLSLLKDDFSKAIDYLQKMPPEKRYVRFVRWKYGPYAQEFAKSDDFKRLFAGYENWRKEMLSHIELMSQQ